MVPEQACKQTLLDYPVLEFSSGPIHIYSIPFDLIQSIKANTPSCGFASLMLLQHNSCHTLSFRRDMQDLHEMFVDMAVSFFPVCDPFISFFLSPLLSFLSVSVSVMYEMCADLNIYVERERACVHICACVCSPVFFSDWGMMVGLKPNLVSLWRLAS